MKLMYFKDDGFNMEYLVSWDANPKTELLVINLVGGVKHELALNSNQAKAFLAWAKKSGENLET